jgi:hypothetical protein
VTFRSLTPRSADRTTPPPGRRPEPAARNHEQTLRQGCTGGAAGHTPCQWRQDRRIARPARTQAGCLEGGRPTGAASDVATHMRPDAHVAASKVNSARHASKNSDEYPQWPLERSTSAEICSCSLDFASRINRSTMRFKLPATRRLPLGRGVKTASLREGVSELFVRSLACKLVGVVATGRFIPTTHRSAS